MHMQPPIPLRAGKVGQAWITSYLWGWLGMGLGTTKTKLHRAAGWVPPTRLPVIICIY